MARGIEVMVDSPGARFFDRILAFSPIFDRGADALVAAESRIEDFFDPRVLTLQLGDESAPFIIWGPDIQPAPLVLPMWAADP